MCVCVCVCVCECVRVCVEPFLKTVILICLVCNFT